MTVETMTVKEPARRIALNNILVATDFSKVSERALDYAVSCARRYGSHLDIAHVVDPETFVPTPMENGKMFSMEETKRVLTTRLRDLAIAAGHDITTHPLLEEGRVGKAIHKLALQRETDLVVVGTHGGGTLQRLMLGSRAEEIFREVPCPVLTVGPCVYRRPALEIRFKHILYATDFSANSAHAAPLALSLAEQYRASLTLLHIMPSDMISQSEVSRHSAHYRRELRKLVPEETERWCRTAIRVEQGPPGSVITQFANESGVDLIILGAKKAPAMASRLVSGTAYQVVCHADCPVLTVRAR